MANKILLLIKMSRITVPAGIDHYFTQSVRPSVPKLQNKATITTGRDRGLSEWIIDDTCLVIILFLHMLFVCPLFVSTFKYFNHRE